MSFQIKNFSEIVAGQVRHARAVTDKITDFLPGSVARTLMEAPASEMEELYIQMLLGLRDAIPVATFLSFGFDALPSAVAQGWVTVFVEPPPAEDVTIPAGVVFTASDGRQYPSSEEIVWVAGQDSVRVPVAAAQAGAAGNAAVGTITWSDFFVGGGFTIGNSVIDGGRDDETREEREARFAQYVAALSRGTVVACEYAIRLAKILNADGGMSEYVTRVGVLEVPGYVRYYVYSNKGLPSAELLNIAQVIVDGKRDVDTGVVVEGYRAGGVRVDVLPMVSRAVTLTIAVEMFPGYQLNADVRLRLDDIFGQSVRAVGPGQTLYINQLTDRMLGVQGVRLVVPASSENFQCRAHEALAPGVLNIAAL